MLFQDDNGFLKPIFSPNNTTSSWMDGLCHFWTHPNAPAPMLLMEIIQWHPSSLKLSLSLPFTSLPKCFWRKHTRNGSNLVMSLLWHCLPFVAQWTLERVRCNQVGHKMCASVVIVVAIVNQCGLCQLTLSLCILQWLLMSKFTPSVFNIYVSLEIKAALACLQWDSTQANWSSLMVRCGSGHASNVTLHHSLKWHIMVGPS